MANKKVTLYGSSATLDAGPALNRIFLEKKDIYANTDLFAGVVEILAIIEEHKVGTRKRPELQVITYFKQTLTLRAANGKRVFTSNHSESTKLCRRNNKDVKIKEVESCKIFVNCGVPFTKANGVDEDDVKTIRLVVTSADATSKMDLDADGNLTVYMEPDKFGTFAIQGHLVPRHGSDTNVANISLSSNQTALLATFVGHGGLDVSLLGKIEAVVIDVVAEAKLAVENATALYFGNTLSAIYGGNPYASEATLIEATTPLSGYSGLSGSAENVFGCYSSILGGNPELDAASVMQNLFTSVGSTPIAYDINISYCTE
jgi:hypothetical protein